MSQKSLLTSDKLYYKLKWHEKVDTKKANITFLNFGNLKTISYHDWIPMEKGGEIPWHRIYQFHYQNELLWDRNERFMDLELLNKEEIFNNIEMLKFENKKWITSKKENEKLPEQINIITFNCLMDLYEKQITNIKPRMPIICQYLKEYNADIVCLQEITIKMKKYIMNDSFIQQNYYVTSNEPKIFGQIILTKYKPLTQNLVTLNGNHLKKYLHLLYTNEKDEKIEIYNIHLTSNDQINSEEKREVQISQILNQVKYDKVILCGDFNGDYDINGFYDSWKLLKENEEGFTFDYMENGLTYKVTKKYTRSRIDKILIKGIKPITIDLCFKEPVENIHASDHFGVLSTISLIEEYEVQYETQEKEIIKENKYIVKPGNVLLMIMHPKYWSFLNEIRKSYDDNYLKIPPHVTLFQRIVDIYEWLNLREQLLLQDDLLVFNQLEIFELSIKFVLVLTCNESYKINTMRGTLENILDIKLNSTPHISLGEFDSLKKAQGITAIVLVSDENSPDLEEPIDSVDVVIYQFLIWPIET